MHPQLTLHNNPMCVEQILAFKKCHAEAGYWWRVVGGCNEPKALMDKCFRAQKKVKRKINREEGHSTAGPGAPGRGAWKKELEQGVMAATPADSADGPR